MNPVDRGHLPPEIGLGGSVRIAPSTQRTRWSCRVGVAFGTNASCTAWPWSLLRARDVTARGILT